MKTIMDIVINLLLSIIAIVSFVASYGFCNGTFIGNMLGLLVFSIATGSTFWLGYRINK